MLQMGWQMISLLYGYRLIGLGTKVGSKAQLIPVSSFPARIYLYVLRAVLGFQFKRVFPSIKTIYSTCLQGQVRSPSPLSIICHKEPKILIKSKYRIHEMCVIPTIYCSTRPHGPKRRRQKRNMRFGDAKNKNTVRLDCEKAIKRSWGLPLRKKPTLGGK